MAADRPTDPRAQTPDEKPRRRARYPGSHPRRFEQRYKELRADEHPGIADHIRAQGRTPAGMHVPVLVREVLETLHPAPGEIVADGTLGYGGHAAAFLARIRPGGILHGFDVDRVELERTRLRLRADDVQVVTHHGNFAGIAAVLRKNSLRGFDIVFADLGVSSMQVDDPARGFSFKHDGPLDMRMDDRLRRTAADLLATLPAEALSAALRDLADEPQHERIADHLVAVRSTKPITRTLELVAAILEATGDRTHVSTRDRRNELHPAARTFQALRILVNDELAALRALLRDAPHCLNPGGRLGIISFHSGEDRIVKHALREGHRAGLYSHVAPECIRPGSAERRDNPRSASAKFRWAVRAAE